MDSRGFDELTKRLGEKTSRGRALKLFGGALVGSFVGAGAARANPPQKHCKFQGYNCGDNTECCSLNCCNRTCCGNGQTCCGGQCVQCPSGQTVNTTTCQCESGGTSPPPPPPPPPPACQGPNDCPPAAAGSCQTAACVSGTCTFVADDANVPICGECFTGFCISGQPVCNPNPVGSPCTNGVCDGTGMCVPNGMCATPNDCPGTDSECQQRTCTAGICGFTFASAGTACGMGGICDGTGGCMGG